MQNKCFFVIVLLFRVTALPNPAYMGLTLQRYFVVVLFRVTALPNPAYMVFVIPFQLFLQFQFLTFPNLPTTFPFLRNV